MGPFFLVRLLFEGGYIIALLDQLSFKLQTSCTQELRNSIGVTSHPVAPLLPRKVLQSMAKLAGGRFEACGWLNYTHHTI